MVSRLQLRLYSMRLLLSSGLPQSLWEVVRNVVRQSEEHLHSYQLLHQNGPQYEYARSRHFVVPATLHQYLNKRLLACVVSLVLLASIFSGFSSLGTNARLPLVTAHKDHLLYLVVPTTQSDTELCKTLGTAAVLGYPTPYLLDWAAANDAPEQRSDHLYQMVLKTRDQLSVLNPQDDQIMLLLDGPYNWFQLRPEVLLGRYYSIVERANRAMMKNYGQTVVTNGGMRPSLVLSAQSVGPNDPNPIASIPNAQSLNVGSMIGPAMDIRALFNRVAAKLEHSTNAVTAQTVFKEVFSQQEIRREAFRQQSWSGSRRTWGSLAKVLGFTGTVIDGDIDSVDEDEVYEFGITVDDQNELGLSAGRSADAVEWTQHNAVSSSVGSTPPLPVDIAQSMPPFWTTSGYGVPVDTRWEDVSLLVDKRTKSIPAIINHGTGSTLQSTSWSELWMHAHARELYEAQLSVPRLPFAGVVDGSGVEHIFWNPDTVRERDGARSFAKDWIAWADMCNHSTTWTAMQGS